jgi:hypothetical protein
MENRTKLLLMLVIATTFYANAQVKILVPYKVGNFYGLSDLSGKLVLPAKYNSIEPIGEGVYQYINTKFVNDTVQSYGGTKEVKKRGVRFTGVIVGSKIIIENSNHNHFTYLEEGLIVGSQETYISKNSNFYTLKGEKLLSENVSKFRIILSPKTGNAKAPASIAILAELMNGKVSVFLFDCQKQKLLAPILDEVTGFKIDQNASFNNSLVCTYYDKNSKFCHDVLFYNKAVHQYQRTPYIDVNSQRKLESDNEELVGYGEGNSMEVMGEPDFPTVEGDSPGSTEETKAKVIEEVFYFDYYKKDSVLYNSKPIQFEPNETLFFADPYSQPRQKQALIFNNGKQYGLLLSDTKRSPVLYDSLIYLYNQYSHWPYKNLWMFMAGKKDQATGQWQFGLLDENGNVKVPLDYDLIQIDLMEISYESDDEDEKGVFRYKYPSYNQVSKTLCLKVNQRGNYLVLKDGKYGIITGLNEIVLPIEYDRIWKNKIQFLKTYEIKNDFNVYQKGNLYGAFEINYEGKLSKNTGLVFKSIPVYAYYDYMKVKGMDIYNLAEPGNLLFCLANNKGLHYYKSK